MADMGAGYGARGPRGARQLAEFVFWWAAAVGIWLLTLSSVSKQGLVSSFACAVPCGVLAVVSRHVVAGRWTVDAAAICRASLLLPVAIVADTGRLLVLPLRLLAGRADEEGRVERTIWQLARDPRDVTAASARAAGRRTLLTAAVSATPGTMVMDAKPSGQLVLHRMVSGRPSIQDAVRGAATPPGGSR